MIPILTPEEMAGVDKAATEPVDVLIGRAGFQTARAARAMLGGSYGRRVTVVAGRGNNGADGRAAGELLELWGAKITVLDASSAGESLPPSDLVIDAAYGTGLSRPYHPPDASGAPVLAVDIPSGLSGLIGKPIGDEAVRATRTVTFASYKPGLLLGQGPEYAGEVEVADIGLGSLVDTTASTWLVTDSDVAERLPRRPRSSHKWQTAVQVVAGSPGMHGAALLVASGAMRAGSGYARVGLPGAPAGGGLPPGAYVTLRLPAEGWDVELLEDISRVKAIVAGPGLGQPAGGAGKDSALARLLLAAPDVPAVVDADGLRALDDLETVALVAKARTAATVLTPHDGEYQRLVGHPPQDDRIADVGAVASQTGAVVLLKGSTTVVAEPGGRAYLTVAGSARLATAGTGDVLSGVIGAFLARGLPGLEAAAFASHVHGRAASLGHAEGLVATDLPELVAQWLSGLSR